MAPSYHNPFDLLSSEADRTNPTALMGAFKQDEESYPPGDFQIKGEYNKQGGSGAGGRKKWGQGQSDSRQVISMEEEEKKMKTLQDEEDENYSDDDFIED